MKTIQINGTEVSVIGVGSMRIAGMNREQADSFVRNALNHEINFFDLADIYGGGRSEQVLGEVIAADPSIREKMYIQSKCGIRQGYFDFSKEHILSSVDGILERLKTDHLDSLLLHRPDVLMELDEVQDAFDELEQSGKVLTFGVSNQNPVLMDYMQSGLRQKLAINQVQLSCAHTVMIDALLNVDMHNEAGIERDGGVIPYSIKNGIALQAWSPLQMGYFEGVFLGNEKYAELNAKLEEIASKYGVDSDTIAYAWILRLPGKMQVITGTTNNERINHAAAAADITLTRSEWYDIYRAAGNKLP